jgi:tetratricopeptide (TPR) repeat protein
MPDFSSVQIPKPLDWQAFQRGCVPLFRKLIGDPSLAEFGRSGQNQNGIDLLGYRQGDLARPVGVQCRHIKELTDQAVRKSVEQARVIDPPLTEIIFATTAPHDANIQREAMLLTKELVKSGWRCRVTILGWEALQSEIASCQPALEMFWPAVTALSQRGNTEEILAALQAHNDRVVDAIGMNKAASLPPPLDQKMPAEALAERRDVHDRISVCRDLLTDGKTETAIELLDRIKSTVENLEPFARYRIEANIGAAHLRAGRPDQALTQWRIALQLRPEDPKARANVALGLLATGDEVAATQAARELLEVDPAQQEAIVILLHTCEKSVDPFGLVPDVVKDFADVQASLISALRKLDDQRWHAVVDDARLKHPDDIRFRQWAAERTLEPILADSGPLIGQPLSDATIALISEATNTLLSVWEIASKDESHDKLGHASLAQNCAAALNFCHRTEEAAAVIDQAMAHLGKHKGLVRIRALLHLHCGEEEDAARLLGDNPTDPELALMRAEIFARSSDFSAAIALVDRLDVANLGSDIKRVTLRITFELSVDTGDFTRAKALVGQLEALAEPAADLALMRARLAHVESLRQTPAAAAVVEEEGDIDPVTKTSEVGDLVKCLNEPSTAFHTRLAGAQFLESLGENELASEVLHERVDMTRDSVALRTYLGSSVAAGLLIRARDALASLPVAVSALPFYKRLNAALLWNTGDARSAARIVDELRRANPKKLDLFLWYVDCLLRLDKLDAIRALTQSIAEYELDGALKEKVRLARVLVTFGQEIRALKLAYKLFMNNRDAPDAWMGLTAVVFGLPRGDVPDLLSDSIDDDSVFEIETSRHGVLSYAIETDEELRHLRTDAIGIDHPYAISLRGHKPGENVDVPGFGSCTVLKVKNKYLEAFHIAADRYNARLRTH